MFSKDYKLSIIQKVYIFLFLACIIPTLIFGYFVINNSNSILSDEFNEYTQDLIDNKKRNMELTMQSIESLIVNITNNDDIRSILISEKPDDSYKKLSTQAKMGYILSGYLNLKGLISIDIFSTGGNHYHVGDTLDFHDIRNDLLDRIFKEAKDSERNIIWNGLEENINKNSSYKKVIMASKIINAVDSDSENVKPLGLIIVNLDAGFFNKYVENKIFEEPVYIVLDNKDRIVVHPDNNIIGNVINPVLIGKLKDNTGKFDDYIDGEKVYVNYVRSNVSGWKIIGIIPFKVVEEKTDIIVKNMLILILFYLAMIFIFTLIVSNKYLSPIKKITELLKELRRGKILQNVRLKSKSEDEIGELTHWFNSFMDSLKEKHHMEEELKYREKLLKGISDATKVLLESTEYEEAFNRALEILGEITNVDRICIFQNHSTKDKSEVITNLRFSWNRSEDLKNEYYNEMLILSNKNPIFSNLHSKLLKGDIISGPVKYMDEEERAYFTKRGILSKLSIPIFIDNFFWGTISFDDCTNERIWTKAEEDTLKIAAASIGGAIKRIEAEKALQEELRDDFKNTVKNSQTIVFKLKKTEDDKIICTLAEGRIAYELGLNTEYTAGKTFFEIFDTKTAEYFNEYLTRVFKGELYNFEIELYGRIFYVAVSPVFENGEVVEVFGSATDVTENKKTEEKIRYMAYYDTLTDLPNRSLFNEKFNDAMQSAKKHDNLLSVMFLDLDQFKLINDTMGHSAGDALLREVSARLKKCVGDKGTICRIGGDEFAILFSNIQGIIDVNHLAEMVLNAFESPFVLNDGEHYISTSIGISIYPYDGTDVETLLKNADMAMYRAKEFGRNNFIFFSSYMEMQAEERLNLINSLRKALEKNEFTIHYQPKMDINTGKITGSEALIRWNSPEGYIIMPGEFISLAEETGLIIPIGEWVLKTACAQNKKWNDERYSDLNIAVNISARQFQHSNIIDLVLQVLKETGLKPKNLELEITENSIMKDTVRTLNVIKELKSIGVKISIDDFGTGFSSLSYLKRFKVDKIKLDRSFITDIYLDKSDAAITSAVINMAKSLNLKVIAEGVESKEQISLLKKFGCDEIQGYLLSKPLSAEKFEDFLKKGKAFTEIYKEHSII